MVDGIMGDEGFAARQIWCGHKFCGGIRSGDGGGNVVLDILMGAGGHHPRWALILEMRIYFSSFNW